MKLSRIILMLLALPLAAIGVGFWATTEHVAQPFQIKAAGAAGMISLCADLGGLFLGLAALGSAGVLLKRRDFMVAAALILAAYAIGRLTGLMVSGAEGASGVPVASLAVEAMAIAALVVCARRLRV